MKWLICTFPLPATTRPEVVMAKTATRSVFRSALVAIVLAMIATMLPAVLSAPTAFAAAGLCPDKSGNSYHGTGPDCTGFDPEKYCADDAITVGSIAVMNGGMYDIYVGQLDLRYSPSCKANWGRFTPAYSASALLRGLLGLPAGTYGSLRVWDWAGRSQGSVPRREVSSGVTSQWTYMVDGTRVACVSVTTEVGEVENWVMGPCV